MRHKVAKKAKFKYFSVVGKFSDDNEKSVCDWLWIFRIMSNDILGNLKAFVLQ